MAQSVSIKSVIQKFKRIYRELESRSELESYTISYDNDKIIRENLSYINMIRLSMTLEIDSVSHCIEKFNKEIRTEIICKIF